MRRGQERRRTAALCSPSYVSARRTEFGASESLETGIPPCGDEHVAVRQQGRGVLRAGVIEEAAGGRPSPSRRIVEFCARGKNTVANSACDEHHAIGQQRRRVKFA